MNKKLCILFSFLFLLTLNRAHAGIFDTIQLIAGRDASFNADSSTIAQTYLSFGKELKKLTESAQNALEMEIGGQSSFTIRSVETHLDYISVIFSDKTSAVVVDLRYEDQSSFQIYFIGLNSKDIENLARISEINDIVEQNKAFFETFGSLYVRQQGDHLSLWELDRSMSESTNNNGSTSSTSASAASAPSALKCAICDVVAGSADCEKLLQCSQCKSVFYCSKKCQRKDWKSGHKETCHPKQ